MGVTTITPKQLAASLRVSRSTLHRMRIAGELPPVIPTSRRIVRWLESDVALWLELSCPSTADFANLKRDKQRFARKRRGQR